MHARARSVHDESPNTEGANDGILPDFRGVGNRRREYQRRGRVPPPTNTMAADFLFEIVSDLVSLRSPTVALVQVLQHLNLIRRRGVTSR